MLGVEDLDGVLVLVPFLLGQQSSPLVSLLPVFTFALGRALAKVVVFCLFFTFDLTPFELFFLVFDFYFVKLF